MGIDAADGIYVSFLDDDDEYLNSFLASTYSSFRNAPDEVGISFCGVRNIHYPSKANLAPTISISEFAANKNGPTLVEYFLSRGTGEGVAMKASCLQAVGPFNRALKVASDTDMFIRILEKGYMPLAVPGVHKLRHHHRGSRLTSATLTPRGFAYMKSGSLIEHAEFLEQHPTIREGHRDYLDSLSAIPLTEACSRDCW